ncbi:imelysin family protein [uncultured Ferrovibrio sp.]|jgi:putative iron-regulated protein|uniref:imelysin family protein n=1 Tax=uncultured Ferrovibrio sp. TaxID=1576913 RepID=UPI00260718AA|nr:imelysin family protein [uncultured Ferrovibrio sp.]
MFKPLAVLLLAAALLMAPRAEAAASDATKQAVLKTYADIAQAMYEDSLQGARNLHKAVAALIAKPSEATMKAAREAWLAARIPYQQTEVYRFGNAIVDDWEGRVNAWPLDEGLIDYVDTSSYGEESDENPLYTANIIANTQIKFGGKTLDASKIDWKLLRKLHEVGGVEANVATGYHAIEFLLWGQDLNGTEAGAGNRPWTDYAKDGCTNGNCDRRAQYLAVATQLLVDDLAWMAKQWQPGGDARKALTEKGVDAGIGTILTGIGSLSYGELAGERMKLGLLLNDPEEEHDCFSDNTHNSHYYNVVGMLAVYNGEYKRTNGAVVKGPGLSQVVRESSPELDREMLAKLNATLEAMTALKQRAESKEAYDQMIGAGNAEGNAIVQAAIDRLTDQTRTLERVVASLDLKAVEFEGSDSLDAPEKVGKK